MWICVEIVDLPTYVHVCIGCTWASVGNVCSLLSGQIWCEAEDQSFAWIGPRAIYPWNVSRVQKHFTSISTEKHPWITMKSSTFQGWKMDVTASTISKTAFNFKVLLVLRLVSKEVNTHIPRYRVKSRQPVLVLWKATRSLESSEPALPKQHREQTRRQTRGKIVLQGYRRLCITQNVQTSEPIITMDQFSISQLFFLACYILPREIDMSIYWLGHILCSMTLYDTWHDSLIISCVAAVAFAALAIPMLASTTPMQAASGPCRSLWKSRRKSVRYFWACFMERKASHSKCSRADKVYWWKGKWRSIAGI